MCQLSSGLCIDSPKVPKPNPNSNPISYTLNPNPNPSLNLAKPSDYRTFGLPSSHHLGATCVSARSPAVAEGPRDAGVPVEILAAIERLYYTPNEYRSRVCVSLTAYVKVHSHRRD